MKLNASTPAAAHVTLSRRNLLALLAMLDEPTHVSKTIAGHFEPSDANGHRWQYLEVTAEEDAEHYAGRQPGRMGARIEKRLVQAASGPRPGYVLPPADPLLAKPEKNR
jgi:hypothetical protein